MNTMQTGLITWSDPAVEFESAESYHSRPGISVSKLKVLRESPELFYRQEVAKLCEFKTTDAMDLGSAVHEDVLLEAVERSWMEIPADVLAKNGARIGNAWKEFAAANPGRLLLKADQVAKAKILMDSVQSNPTARDLIYDNRQRLQTELTITCTVSMVTRDGELLSSDFRSRLDYMRPEKIVDLKTTRDGSLEKWPFLARDLGYDMQAAAYRQMAGLLDGVARDVYFVVVENCEPFRCDVWHARDNTLREGMVKLEAAIADYLLRNAAGDWTRDYFGEVLEF